MDNRALTTGIFLVLGGILGYSRKRSAISLLSGLLTGILFILGGVLASSDEARSIKLNLAASALLFVGSAPRALRSRKPLPLLLTLVASYGLYTYVPPYRSLDGPHAQVKVGF